ncbi:hypothetical protein BTA35_0206780 [Oceanospirillum linum]|uniref:HEPN domain-containing protein n=1 Tax=Oceanospirillum linum TaxID=966 RepID=A0A1T1HDL5_OCELI|nr:hypothetical protein BTA35_0206780 [Oceanospirillum linum]
MLFATNIESAVRGHDLKSIFTKLKLETQEGIKSEFESATGENLIPLLEECSRYFEDGRYSFEKIGGSYSLSGVRTLAKGLLDAVMAFGKNHA